MEKNNVLECFNYFYTPIAVCDAKGKIISTNEAFDKLFSEFISGEIKNVKKLFKSNPGKKLEIITNFLKEQNVYNNTFDLNVYKNKTKKIAVSVFKLDDKYTFLFYPQKRFSQDKEIIELINKITSTFDLDDILEKAIAGLSNLFSFTGYNISIIDEDTDQLRVLKFDLPDINKESINFYRTAKYPLNKDGGILVESVLENKVIYIPDREEHDIESTRTQLLMVNLNIRSQLLIPMVMETLPVGVIGFYTHGDKKLILDEEDIEYIKNFITPITIAINNALLHNKVMRQTIELERIIENRTREIQKKNIELEKLSLITQKMNATLNIDEVLDLLHAELSKLYFFEGFAVMLMDDSKDYLFTLKLIIPNLEDKEVERIAKRRVPLDVEKGGGVAFAVLQKRDMYFEDVDPEKLPDGVNKEAVVKTGGIKSALILPMKISDEVVGVMILSAYTCNLGFTDDDISSIRRFVDQIASAIKNSFLHDDLQNALNDLERANRKLKKQKKLLKDLAITDALTQIRNRRYFDERIVEDYEKCKRYNQPLFILMMDIDNFKSVNDTYGHDYGDYVLVEFTNILSKNVRKSDLLARYGGEEFIIAMFETDANGAKIVAEKIRSMVEDHDFMWKNIHIKRTISIGISCYPSPLEPQDSVYTIVKEADEALYIAKNTGKNKWVYYWDLEENDRETEKKNYGKKTITKKSTGKQKNTKRNNEKSTSKNKRSKKTKE